MPICPDPAGPAVTYSHGRCFVYSITGLKCVQCGMDVPPNVAHCCRMKGRA